MSLAVRLKKARKTLGLTQIEAATKFALPLGSLRKYESGPSEPGSSALSGIARSGINTNWLLTGEGEMFIFQQPDPDLTKNDHQEKTGETLATPDNKVTNTDYLALPLQENINTPQSLEATSTTETNPYVLMFNKKWIRHELGANPLNLYLLKVKGNSMEPTLRPGDLILVDKCADEPVEEGIYALKLNNSILVKNIQLLPGKKMRMSADNPAYEPFNLSIPSDNNILILGRVVWSGRRF